jgi:hypothetical protein
MARKRAGGASKSELIRTTSAENPSAGPTEIAKLIETAHSVSVSPAMVSTVLSQDRTRGGKPAKRGRPPKSAAKTTRKKAGAKEGRSDLSIETLLRVKKLADEMGGVNEAKKALDALATILS